MFSPENSSRITDCIERTIASLMNFVLTYAKKELLNLSFFQERKEGNVQNMPTSVKEIEGRRNVGIFSLRTERASSTVRSEKTGAQNITRCVHREYVKQGGAQGAMPIYQNSRQNLLNRAIIRARNAPRNMPRNAKFPIKG